MGRKGDTPAQQAAKGFPGRRKTRVQKRLLSQSELAAAISAAPPAGSDPLSPPSFMDEQWAGALAIWQQLAPRLASSGRLASDWRFTFAMFCVYMAEWIECCREIVERGPTQRIKNVSGSLREVDRPVVRRREIASQNVAALAKGFGLTPNDYYPLLRERAHVDGRDLFQTQQPQNNREIQEGGVSQDSPSEPPRASALGALAAVNSRPPNDLIN